MSEQGRQITETQREQILDLHLLIEEEFDTRLARAGLSEGATT